jgi:hypothetical protein
MVLTQVWRLEASPVITAVALEEVGVATTVTLLVPLATFTTSPVATLFPLTLKTERVASLL